MLNTNVSYFKPRFYKMIDKFFISEGTDSEDICKHLSPEIIYPIIS